jgi:hypothetical protein
MVNWFVSSTKDIADFYTYIRDEKNGIAYEKTVPYSTRQVAIKGSDIKSNSRRLEICVLAKSSDDDVYFVENQCRRLPDDFEDIKSKYNEYYEYKYALKLQAPNVKSDGNANALCSITLLLCLYTVQIWTVYRPSLSTGY